jgi:N-dimethylarginine dimethylaminohydrolase
MSVLEKPELYHEVLKFFPAMADPPHEDPNCMERFWGRNWGANSAVGRLRSVLVHRPGDEMKQIDESKWNEECQALISDDGSWYWRSQKGPDLSKMQEQHDNFCNIMQEEGVEVIYLDYRGTTLSRSVFTNDLGMAIPGGVILGRMGPMYRRGEEFAGTRTFGSLGIPILRTIHGRGILEGGNFSFLDSEHAVIGSSPRTNREGIAQVRETLTTVGVELLEVPVSGYTLYLDGAFLMVKEDMALINAIGLPFFFIEKLREFGIKTIDVHPKDEWLTINCLQLRPGRLIMAEGFDRTAERLDKAGVEVIQIPFDELLKNGGGPHCSAFPLQRDHI